MFAYALLRDLHINKEGGKDMCNAIILESGIMLKWKGLRKEETFHWDMDTVVNKQFWPFGHLNPHQVFDNVRF